MYKYLLDGNASRLVVTQGEEKVCEADIVINDDIARLDFIDIKRTSEDSLINLAMGCCKEVKTLLTDKGMNVVKVQIGGILAVAKYDEALSKIDTKKNVRVGMR